ncbi:hypothetical protein BDN70DRAFT_881851 [Pholiota conissans]|uniref:Uncharacterized protein n=1 Tax=Pholiota conissans TaxID=109636 RepID=A0A9P5YXF2_9AGAR|nr:hypothetical protein BDN70DRAFT_881851 [Pholiota conissans]
MGDPLIHIQYVVVDDINFTPIWTAAMVIGVSPLTLIADLMQQIRLRNPSLQNYDEGVFRVLKIINPVSPETVVPAMPNTARSSALRSGAVRPSLQPILELLRQRSKEAKQTELANDYVQILPFYT